MAMYTDPSCSDAESVTPSDSANLALPTGCVGTKYLYVGVSGDVVVTTAGGQTATLKSLAAGVFHPIKVKQVKSTGTTATNILALY